MADNKPENYDGRESEEPQIWSMEPFRRNRKKTYVHNPCGHWHLPMASVSSLCLEYKNTVALDPVHNFYSGTMIIGSDDRLYVMFGGYSASALDAKMEVYDKATFELLDSETYSVSYGIYVVTRIREHGGHIWVLHDGVLGSIHVKWLTRIKMSDLSLVDQRICGDVVPGTDGKIYTISGNVPVSTFWDSYYKPVTGSNWAAMWAEMTAGYAFHVYSAYDDTSSHRGSMSIRDFLIDDSYVYLTDDLLSIYTRGIIKRTHNMERVASWGVGYGGMTEAVWSPDKTKIAFIVSSISTAGPSYICILQASDLTQLVYESLGGAFRSDVYQNSSLIWHSNNYIYNVQYEFDGGGQDKGRVIKINTSNGNVDEEYVSPTKDVVTPGRIVASARNIYWFQPWQGNTTYGGIIKLDLDLDVVCIEPFHFVDWVNDDYVENIGTSEHPLIIDTDTHMIYNCMTQTYRGVDAGIIRWDYFA